MPTDTCPACGAQVSGGEASCHSLYERLAYQALEDPRIAHVLTLAFDAYCMQHVEQYGRSAKSYAAHLTRLCAGLEHDGQPELYAALQRWYHGGLVKPAILAQRGTLHITDVRAVDDVEEKCAMIRACAANVWDAYAEQQPLARTWVEEARKTRRK